MRRNNPKNETDVDSILITQKEFARLLLVSTRTIRGLTITGEGPRPVRGSGWPKWKLKDIRDYLARLEWRYRRTGTMSFADTTSREELLWDLQYITDQQTCRVLGIRPYRIGAVGCTIGLPGGIYIGSAYRRRLRDVKLILQQIENGEKSVPRMTRKSPRPSPPPVPLPLIIAEIQEGTSKRRQRPGESSAGGAPLIRQTLSRDGIFPTERRHAAFVYNL